MAKTLTGRDMAEGQFTIKVTPGDEASAYALGLPLEGAEIAMPAAADGAQAVKSALGEQHVVLRQSDVGKTYTYKVVEVQAAADGYTYDTTEYAVTVMAWDDPQKAALTVTTEVAGPEGTKTYVFRRRVHLRGEIRNGRGRPADGQERGRWHRDVRCPALHHRDA